jgi:hypothetical protein
MKILTVLFVVLAVWLGATVLVPLIGFTLAIAVPLGGFLIWLLPILIIAGSDRTAGAEKLAWILAIVFLSWFAWIFYFLLAPISGRHHYRDYAGYRPYRSY